MDLTKSNIAISYSAFKIFVECPQKFYYVVSNERRTDKHLRTLIVSGRNDLASMLRNNDNMIVDMTSQSPPINLSASGFGNFKKCKQLFKWKLIDREKPTDPISITPFSFGTLVHTKFDAFIAGIHAEGLELRNCDFKERFKAFYNSKELREQVVEFINKVPDWKNEKQKQFTDFYNAIANHYRFINSIIEKGCEPIFNFWFGTTKNPLTVDMIELSAFRLVGEIDHYYINPRGNITIEDTKTSKSTYYLDHDQLFFYAIAIEQVYKNRGENRKVDELNFNLVRLGKRHTIPFGSLQKDAMFSRLGSLDTALQLNLFKPQRSKNCESCPYRTKCARENFSSKEDAETAKLKSMLDRGASALKDPFQK